MIKLIESLENYYYKYKGSFETEEVPVEDEETGEEYIKNVLKPLQTIRFKTESGIPYLWYAKQSRYDDYTWNVAFGVEKGVNWKGNIQLDIGKTEIGVKEAFRIFSTVINIINNFIEFDDDYGEIQRLVVSSKGENRTNLYLKRILPRIENFKISDVIKDGDETTITMDRQF